MYSLGLETIGYMTGRQLLQILLVTVCSVIVTKHCEQDFFSHGGTNVKFQKLYPGLIFVSCSPVVALLFPIGRLPF